MFDYEFVDSISDSSTFIIINKLRTMCNGWILDPMRSTQNKIESEKLLSSYNLTFTGKNLGVESFFFLYNHRYREPKYTLFLFP